MEFGDAFVMCSQICLAVNMEEDEIGGFLTEGGGEDGVKSSGCWKLRREGELGGWLSERGRWSERFDSCLVVENIFNPTSAT